MQSSEITGFVIQREDAAWYAERAEVEAVSWTTERDQRHVFKSGKEAMETLERLQASGHNVRLYALI